MIDEMKNIFRIFRGRQIRRYVERMSEPHTLPGSRVSVIAPHPDDETFGCGGMLARRVARGDGIQIIFLTNGEGSLRTVDVSAQEVVEARQRHAKAAVAELGVSSSDLKWLGLPDGQLPRVDSDSFPPALDAIALAVEAHNPNVIYAPHLADGWGDHVAAAELAIGLIRDRGCDAELYFYGIWMWNNVRYSERRKISQFPPQCLMLESELNAKLRAIDCFLAERPKDISTPFCGDLPAGFVDHFRTNTEVFFDGAEAVRPNRSLHCQSTE